MSTSIIDVSQYGKIRLSNLTASIIEAGKSSTANTYSDILLRAYNTNKTKYVTATLSAQSDIPKLTLASTGISGTPATIISGVATPAASSDASNKSYVDTSTSTHAALTTGVHGVGAGSVVGTDLTQTLTNKTLTSATIIADSNTVTANALRVSGGAAGTNLNVNITAAAPTAGQVLTATSGTAATWQSLPLSQKPMGTTITNTITLGVNSTGKHFLVQPTGNITITLSTTGATDGGPFILGNEIDFTLIADFSVTFQANGSAVLYYPGTLGTANNTATWSALDKYSTVSCKYVSSNFWIVLGPVE